MHVERVAIRNFRCLKTADIRLRKGLNLLVGRNGSGKSTVLAALRILLDATLGRKTRTLDDADVFGDVKLAGPANVVIAAQFAGFEDTSHDKELRLRMKAEGDNPSQWLVYRFRPTLEARTQLQDGERKAGDLTINDYESERLIGVAEDPFSLEWDSESSGEELKDKDLATIFVEEIPAVRDVVSELRRQRTSPLAELLASIEVAEPEKERVEAAYGEAQRAMEDVTALAEVATAIRSSYELLTAEAQIQIRLGLTRPGFAAIVQDLGLYLTDDQVSNMELRRNGLGYNNLLYIAMLLENFRRRVAKKEGSPLLLIEEPEAHLHPQSQEALLRSIAGQSFQTIATTHSPYVAVTAGLRTIINLERTDAVKGINLVDAASITAQELSDLDRFLNADRGTLLFAAAVMLVEGPSEQILVPLYASNLGHDLAKLGIQVCSINGTHFAAFQKLLGQNGVNRPFVVIRDGDQHRCKGSKLPALDAGSNIGDGVTFMTATTLEYAITRIDSLEALAYTADHFGKRSLRASLSSAIETKELTGELQLEVLRAAEDVGKARFAQVFGERVVCDHLRPPEYIGAAIEAAIAARLQSLNQAG